MGKKEPLRGPQTGFGGALGGSTKVQQDLYRRVERVYKANAAARAAEQAGKKQR